MPIELEVIVDYTQCDHSFSLDLKQPKLYAEPIRLSLTKLGGIIEIKAPEYFTQCSFSTTSPSLSYSFYNTERSSIDWVRSNLEQTIIIQPSEREFRRFSDSEVIVTVTADDGTTSPNSEVRIAVSFPSF